MLASWHISILILASTGSNKKKYVKTSIFNYLREHPEVSPTPECYIAPQHLAGCNTCNTCNTLPAG